MEVSPIILTKGGFKERRNSISKGIPIDFFLRLLPITIQGT